MSSKIARKSLRRKKGEGRFREERWGSKSTHHKGLLITMVEETHIRHEKDANDEGEERRKDSNDQTPHGPKKRGKFGQ